METTARLARVGICLVSLQGIALSDDGRAPAYNNVCGQLALAAAAEHLGMPGPVERVFELLPANAQPSTLQDLEQAARRLGLRARAIHWRQGVVPQLPGPAIVRLRSSSQDGIGHFVLLLGSSRALVLVLDLPDAARWVPVQDVWRTWDGVALHLALGEAPLPRPERRTELLAITVIGICSGICALLLLRNATALRDVQERPPSRGRRLMLAGAAVSASALALALVYAGARNVSGGAEPAAAHSLVVSPPSQDIVLDDVGVSKPAEPVSAVFRIKNEGALPARVKSVQTSCGCALPTLSSNHIPAGGFVTVNVGISPPENGSQRFTIRLFVDRPTPETLVLPGSVTMKSAERAKLSRAPAPEERARDHDTEARK